MKDTINRENIKLKFLTNIYRKQKIDMVKFINNREVQENSDKDLCIYSRYRSYQDMEHGVWVPHFKPDNWLISYHNGKMGVMWDSSDNNIEPKTGDICPLCGREIIIYE